jgi:DNA mismatch repair protein MutS2
VRSASVIFDPRTKRPLYKLAYDQVGASIALEVGPRARPAADILSRAEQYLLLDGSDSSKLMSRLNELAVARESELDGLTRERLRLEPSAKSSTRSSRRRSVRSLRSCANSPRKSCASGEAAGGAEKGPEGARREAAKR